MIAAPKSLPKLASPVVLPTNADLNRTRARSTDTPFFFAASAPVPGANNASMTVAISSRVVSVLITCRRQMLTLRPATTDASQCSSCTCSRFRPCEISWSSPGRSVEDTPRTMRPGVGSSGSSSTVTLGGPSAFSAAARDTSCTFFFFDSESRRRRPCARAVRPSTLLRRSLWLRLAGWYMRSDLRSPGSSATPDAMSWISSSGQGLGTCDELRRRRRRSPAAFISPSTSLVSAFPSEVSPPLRGPSDHAPPPSDSDADPALVALVSPPEDAPIPPFGFPFDDLPLPPPLCHSPATPPMAWLLASIWISISADVSGTDGGIRPFVATARSVLAETFTFVCDPSDKSDSVVEPRSIVDTAVSAPPSAPPSGETRPRESPPSPSLPPFISSSSSSVPPSLSLSCSVVIARSPYSAHTFPMLSTIPVKYRTSPCVNTNSGPTARINVSSRFTLTRYSPGKPRRPEPATVFPTAADHAWSLAPTMRSSLLPPDLPPAPPPPPPPPSPFFLPPGSNALDARSMYVMPVIATGTP